MAGGLFGTHLYLNAKCLVISLIVVIIYFLPHPYSNYHTAVMAFLLATSTYIGIAWYDVLYDCNDRLQPSLFGWMSKPLKPQSYDKEYQELPLKTKKIIRNFDIFVLVLIIITFVYPFIFRKKQG